MLGISTCWWENRSLSGEMIVRETAELGFGGIELEYRITYPLFEEMRPYVNREVRVLSIHNYFPRPVEFMDRKASGDLFSLSSTDKEERLMAVKYSVKTLEHASDLETEAVILHLGRVDMPDPMNDFRKLYEEDRIKEEEGQRFLEEQKHIRASKSRKSMDAALFSLDELNREAEKKGVYLGIENRYYPQEIPDFDEIGMILREFEGGRVCYWHDAGHAVVQENLGLCEQNKLLEAYSDRMIGVHIHDVNGLVDHLAPGSGRTRFEEIRPFVKPDHIKIMEIESSVGRDELREGAGLIRKMME